MVSRRQRGTARTPAFMCVARRPQGRREEGTVGGTRDGTGIVQNSFEEQLGDPLNTKRFTTSGTVKMMIRCDRNG